MKIKKGKIIKIKQGYSTNFSSGSWALEYAFFFAPMILGIGTTLSIISSIVLYKKHVSKNIKNENKI